MLMNLYNTERCISLSCDSFNTIRQVVADLMGPQVGSDFKSMQNAARIYDTGRWARLMPDSYEKFSQRMAWGMRQHILLDQVDVDIIDFLMQKALDESELLRKIPKFLYWLTQILWYINWKGHSGGS